MLAGPKPDGVVSATTWGEVPPTSMRRSAKQVTWPATGRLVARIDDRRARRGGSGQARQRCREEHNCQDEISAPSVARSLLHLHGPSLPNRLWFDPLPIGAFGRILSKIANRAAVQGSAVMSGDFLGSE